MPSSNILNLKLIIFAVLISLTVTACDFAAQQSPEAHLAKAKEFIANDELNEAVLELKNALQIESNLPEARWLLGKIYLQMGNGAAAYSEITRAQSLGFSDPELSKLVLQAMLLQGKNQEILDQTFTEGEMTTDTLLLRGQAHLGLREFDDARSAFEQILELESKAVGAWKGLIQITLYERKFDDAEKLIEETLAFALEDPEVWILKGQLAFLQNLPAKAEEAFSRAVLYTEANATALFGLARALLAQGKTKEALSPIEAIEARVPNHPQAKYYRAYIALLNKDKDRAKQLLQEVLIALPKHPESLLLLSRIHYDEDQLAQAQTYISTFLASFPQHLPAVKLLSVIQLKLKQPDASVRTLQKAASQVKGDWQVLALLGSALMETGDLEKGVELLEEATRINPDTAAIHTQLAIGHLATGALDSAVAELESAIELDPELVRADILLILTHLKTSNFDTAIEAAKRFAEKHPENSLSYNLLGAGYIGNKNYAEARKQFEKALSIKPDFTPAISNLARLDILNKDTEAAEKKFNEILEIDNNNADALMNLAFIEGRRGNNNKIPLLLERARTGNPANLKIRTLLAKYYLDKQNKVKLLEVISEAHDLSPNHPEVLMMLGHAHRLNGNFDKSIKILSALLKTAPDAEAVLYQLSLSQAQSGKIDAAKDNLKKLLVKNETHLGALIASTRIALSGKNYSRAGELVKIIKNTGDYLVDGYVLEGDLLSAQSKYDEAIIIYKKAWAQLQNSVIAVKLAQAYHLSGKREKAILTINDWLQDNPEDSKASLYLASLYHQSTDNQKAIQNYEKTLEQEPDNVIALNNLAWLFIDSDPARALEFAKRANAQVPDSPEVMDTLGWIMVKQDSVEEGLAYLRPAREAGSHIPGIRYHYAEALHLVGDNDRAKVEIESLLKEFQDFDEREMAEKLRDELN